MKVNLSFQLDGLQTFSEKKEKNYSEPKIPNLNEKSLKNTDYYLKKISEFKILINEINLNPNIQDKNLCLNEIRNTFQDKIEILGLDSETEVILHNSNGGRIQKYSLLDSKRFIDLSEFPSGLFYLKFIGPKGVTIKRLVRN